jgi:hypothetical protein
MVAQGSNSYVKGMGSALLLPNPIPFVLATTWLHRLF